MSTRISTMALSAESAMRSAARYAGTTSRPTRVFHALGRASQSSQCVYRLLVSAWGSPMKQIPAVVATAMLATFLPSAGQSVQPNAAARDGSEADRAAIDRLHEEDREATLSDSAEQLAKLWDKDAVRFTAGSPAEIGAAVIYADDKRWEMSRDRERTLCYDIEIQDSQIAGDWAFEWGYLSGKSSKGGKESIFYGSVMRVMKRQSDGTWRFSRVMVLPAPSASAVVLKHPCH